MYKSRTVSDMRSGPTGNEVILTHAVSRLMLAGHIDNIQVSWVKEGFRMAQVLLNAGVNDFGTKCIIVFFILLSFLFTCICSH